MLKYIFLNKKGVLFFFLIGVLANTVFAFFIRMYFFITEAAIGQYLSNWQQIAFSAATLVLGLFLLFCVIDFFKWVILVNACGTLRNDIIRIAFDLDFIQFRDENISHYSSMLLNDVEIIEDKYFSQIIEIFGEIIQLAVIVIFIAAIEVRFLPVILLFCIPSIFQPLVMRKRLVKIGLVVSKNYEKYTEKAKEFLNNFEIIKLFRKEDVFFLRFSKTVKSLELSRKKQFMLSAVNTIMLILVMYFLKIVLSLYFVSNVISGVVTLATMAVLFGFANQIGNVFSTIADCMSEINETTDVRKKLLRFIINQENKAKTLYKQEISFENRIIFQNVNFSYSKNSSLVLHGFSVCFEKGKKYLLLGESGCGKSTIFRLLMGYYKNYEGCIFFDENELKDVSSKAISNTIAFIDQDTFIFNGTVRDNIALYDTKFSDEQIFEAMVKAGLGAFLASLPNGLNSKVSERGVNFSGGERQCISIARAILANRDILLVDEGTASLDNDTSQEIERNFLSMDKTIIVIAHRVHTNISTYDRVGIIENKNLVAFGKGEELSTDIRFRDYFRTDVDTVKV